ncbi:MAG: type II toxin-antitoxin system RatA family toxin [Xanthomonadaceae bacterium]|jgi:ribosome-associated toxin RatA of RatAB toxin-antitoxin module|nr:type II toxin-antitoxin system RatA family toxin [Xanthomonadaceae bacterium]
MPSISRSALVEHSVEQMFDLVNDVTAYPDRFSWCKTAEVFESSPERMKARLDLGIGSFRTWFTTENRLDRPRRIDMQLRDGPFKRLHGIWEFKGLGESASKVSLTLDFEPNSVLLTPVLTLGFQTLADRMVNDFVRVADQLGDG